MSDVLDVNLAALTRSDDPGVEVPAPLKRRRGWLWVVAAVVALGLVAGGLWWQQAVTSDPGLAFHAINNIWLEETAGTGDRTGLTEKQNLLGTEVDIAFSPGRRVVADWGLYNGGPRAVRIEAVPDAGFYYWGFDRMEVAAQRDLGGVGVATSYAPFRPFILEAGETRLVRLHFRLADCDPAGLQDGSSSIRELKVRYRTLGIERSLRVPFEEFVLAVSTMGICDRPIDIT